MLFENEEGAELVVCESDVVLAVFEDDVVFGVCEVGTVLGGCGGETGYCEVSGEEAKFTVLLVPLVEDDAAR